MTTTILKTFPYSITENVVDAFAKPMMLSQFNSFEAQANIMSKIKTFQTKN